MGRYIDKGDAGFRSARKGEYIDKSGLISVVNATLGTDYKGCADIIRTNHWKPVVDAVQQSDRLASTRRAMAMPT